MDRIILVPGSRGNPWSETLSDILKNKKKGDKGWCDWSTNVSTHELQFLSLREVKES